ncbi:AAA family ATPase [Paenibacillus macerans]|uniref:AAA family ATPase n=1 Tax=Paenibacillus macerans TaxID=44252 RepID=A0A6N8ESX6_PAEMA|nr:ATP-binding protein [Paenibacillus macerans]MUG21890.1 AAA family ATPase [Paenibacillus macerans]OMG46547.1 kinase [Paenibacillus macerans]
MECVIFIGIQASGKSTFYKEKFFKTHMRINLDMLRSRHRENVFLEASLRTSLPFVVDNTNPTLEDRKKYIELAKKHKFKIVGYYFEPNYDLSYERNEQRQGKEKVAEIGIRSTLKKLQIPSYDEGFDELYLVRSHSGKFAIEKMTKD